jgi:alkylhydroperoxidase family enzyme
VEGTRVADATWTVLTAHLSPEHVVDLVLTIGFYCMVVRVLATTGVDVERDYVPVLERFPLPEPL